MNKSISLAGCLLLFIFGLASCSFAPKYERPVAELPAHWSETSSRPLEYNWWERFNDPVLNNLIDEAMLYNRDLAAALARVDQARANLGLAWAEIFPQIGVQGAANKNRLSKRTHTPVTSQERSYEDYSGAGTFSWELDLWGKYRDATKSAQAQLLSSEATRDGVILSLQAEVCRAYFDLRALDAQKHYAEKTLQNREEYFKVYQERYQAGDINELDYQRYKTEVDTARIALAQYTAALEAAEGALAVLLGRSPKLIFEGHQERGLSLDRMPAIPVIPAGLPSELLERRPDIRAAEENLISANAEIGVARAAYFPSISLTGLLGYESASLSRLFTEPASTWAYGGTLTMPILDFGRVRSGELFAMARQREAAAVYEQTVQKAFSDLRMTLFQQQEAATITQGWQDTVNSLTRTTELAYEQYAIGYVAQIDLLDAERQLFNAGLDLISAKRDQLSAIVDLCVALGGGWQEPDSEQNP